MKNWDIGTRTGRVKHALLTGFLNDTFESRARLRPRSTRVATRALVSERALYALH
jgi:hypothetical protein